MIGVVLQANPKRAVKEAGDGKHRALMNRKSNHQQKPQGYGTLTAKTQGIESTARELQPNLRKLGLRRLTKSASRLSLVQNTNNARNRLLALVHMQKVTELGLYDSIDMKYFNTHGSITGRFECEYVWALV